MKVTPELNSENLPSRGEVEEQLNIRTRNPEIEGRIPREREMFGDGLLRLGVTKIPGYHMHWIADYPGRLAQAERNGYEFVTRAEVKTSRTSDDAGERVTHIKGSHESGEPFTLTLMKIRVEWYEENCQYYLERTRRVERQIKSGVVSGIQGAEHLRIPEKDRIGLTTKRE